MYVKPSGNTSVDVGGNSAPGDEGDAGDVARIFFRNSPYERIQQILDNQGHHKYLPP